jgi:hypothetical protein
MSRILPPVTTTPGEARITGPDKDGRGGMPSPWVAPTSDTTATFLHLSGGEEFEERPASDSPRSVRSESHQQSQSIVTTHSTS